MKIAIAGAGLAGLSLAIVLKKANKSLSIDLFDPTQASQRTSALAQLLYPFVGKYSQLNMHGYKAFHESYSFLKQAQSYSTDTLYQFKPIFKLAHHHRQKEPFKLAATTYTELEWKENSSYLLPGILTHKALQVNPILYLTALEKWASQLGVARTFETFTHKHAKNFDHVIYATGSKSVELFPKEPLALLKGQGLILKRPVNFKLPYNLINHHLHVITSIDEQTIYVGNTFERSPQNLNPCLETVKKHLWALLTETFPELTENLILRVQSGVRVNSPNRMPLIKAIDAHTHLFTALGSKGLLYHVLYAKELAEMILNSPNTDF